MLFDNHSYGTEYIADARDSFTEYMSKDIFTSSWARDFECGRYVILILQRHSVYESGSQIYVNEKFDYTVGRFSRYKKACFILISNTTREYKVSSWDRPLITKKLMDENNTLQCKTFFDEEKAMEAAKKYSLSGEKIAVMKWYDDQDMF